MSLHVSGTGWRAYDNFIGQPIFYPGFSENMTAAVLSTPVLQRRITELAEKRIATETKEGLLNKDDPLYASKRLQRKSVIEQSLQELSEKMTGEMICKFESKPFIRGAYYLVTQLLTRAYHQGSLHALLFHSIFLTACRNPCVERRSPPFTKRCGEGREEQTKHYLSALSSVTCGLCLSTTYLLPARPCLTHSSGRR